MLRPRGQVLGGAPAIVMAQIRKDKNTFALVVRERVGNDQSPVRCSAMNSLHAMFLPACNQRLFS